MNTYRWSVVLVAWVGLAFSVLWIERLPQDLDHVVQCGIWGCLPPLQALAAGHLFWFVALAPMAVFVGSSAPAGWAKVSGAVAMTLGCSGLVICAYEAWIVWSGQVGVAHRIHAPRRFAFDVASWVDFPMIQLMAAGTWMIAASRRRGGPTSDRRLNEHDRDK